jgi:hypothetical protein
VRIPPADGFALLDRGVWKAPWMGPHGEIVLLVVSSRRTLLLPPDVIPLGCSHLRRFDELWAILDTLDPLAEREADALRRRTMKVV